MVKTCRNDQFELNTLKISDDTKTVVRKPYVWEKPAAKLYDYHYQIGGLYYQPMISYIVEKGELGPRRVVDIPDRLLSNFDRRAYVLKEDPLELEEFLTEAYRRRTKDINRKFVRVENEKIRHSKKNTSLNMVRGAAIVRDKYLCQLQLAYTEQRAHNKGEDEQLYPILMTKRPKEDDSYGPGFKKDIASSQLETDISKVLEDRYSAEERELYRTKLNNRLGVLHFNTEQALERGAATKQVTGALETPEERFQATYIGAVMDVKRQVEETRREIEGDKLRAQDVQITYRGVPIDQIGIFERNRLKADKFKPRRMPEIDVGYDVVQRELVVV